MEVDTQAFHMWKLIGLKSGGSHYIQHEDEVSVIHPIKRWYWPKLLSPLSIAFFSAVSYFSIFMSKGIWLAALVSWSSNCNIETYMYTIAGKYRKDPGIA